MQHQPARGFARDEFAAARAAFEANFESGADVGASVCVTVGGETVVDLWGGYADSEETRPWERDTLVNVFSSTKTATALTALLVADRGGIDFDKPVAHYWPEFAQAGKEAITVAQLMSHSAGLSGLTTPIVEADLYDWEKMTTLLAAQAPLWAPGSASGYHAMTQGFLVGEVVRRVTGKSLGKVFRDEIAEPLGADFWIGMPASEDHRVAGLVDRPAAAPPPGGFAFTPVQQATFFNMGFTPAVVVKREWRGAEIPAVNGQANARGIAEIHAILANGGVAKGRRFMSEAGCRKALELQIEGPDLIMPFPARFGLGYALPGTAIPLEFPSPNIAFWGGHGGSFVMADFDRRMSFGYAMNKMGPSTVGDARSYAIIRAVWEALGR